MNTLYIHMKSKRFLLYADSKPVMLDIPFNEIEHNVHTHTVKLTGVVKHEHDPPSIIYCVYDFLSIQES